MEERFLLIASRDPQTHASARGCYELAARLAQDGRPVTVFLVQNGVLPARRSPGSQPLEELAARGVRVAADELALRERGIPRDRLARGIEPAPLSLVIEALEQGAKVLWH